MSDIHNLSAEQEPVIGDKYELSDMLVVKDLKMHFPVTKGLLKRQVG